METGARSVSLACNRTSNTSSDATAIDRAEGTERTKILFVIDTLEVGGTERSLLQLVGGLDSDCFEPVVCSVYEGESLRAEFEKAGVRVVCLGLRGKYQFLRAFRRLRRVVVQEQPSLIHTMLFRASQVGRTVGWICRIPVISSFVNVPYDPMRLKVDASVKKFKLNALRFLDSATARLVTRFHAVSETARGSNCNHLRVPPRKVSVIPRGRDVDQYSSECDSETNLPSKKKCPAGYPVVVNVGRLIDQKGQIYLIQAMPELLKVLPRLQVLFAGDGPLRTRLVDAAAELKVEQHVTFLGQCDEVPKLLAQADVFVFPSLYEGLPGAIIEAMLAGCPIVASNIPQVAELIKDGETGLLVPPEDPRALAAAVERLAGNRELAERMGAAARDVARRRYDIRRIVQQTEQFYRDILSIGR